MTPDTDAIRHLVERHTRDGLSRREFLGRAVGLGLSAGAAGVLLDACGGAKTSSSNTGSSGATNTTTGGSSSGKPHSTTLIYRPENDIQNLDPAFYVNQDDFIVTSCIYEGLVTFKPGTWDVVNCLADTFEASKDGLQYHFTLKKGIQWHKGYGEVQASDVKFSYERIAGLTKPNLNSPYSGDWSALETVQVNGPYEGTIILKQPFAPILRSTLPVGSGQVLSEKAVTALGKKYATNPVGSGPYEFVSWTPGQSTKLKKFANYGGANKEYVTPNVPWTEIQTQVVTSPNTALEALTTGTVDFGYVEAATVGNAMKSGNLNVVSRPTLDYYFIAISQKNVPNLNLRRAIRASIDVPAIIEAAYNGRYQRANGIIPASMGVGYWADAPHYNQDLSLAKSYLARAGGSSNPLTITTYADQDGQSAAQVIQANLQQAGMNAKIVTQSDAAFDAIPGNGGGGKDREIVYATYVSEPDPYWSFIWFTCAQINVWNWCDWCNQPFNNLLNEAIRTYDTATRDRLYIQAAQLWDKQSNIIWVAYPTWYFAGQKSIKPSLRPDGYPYLWNMTAT